MKEVAISKFKAKYLAMLEQVRKTKKPIRFAGREPIAEVVPPGPITDKSDWLGSMKGQIEILGDIVSPVIDLDDIEALRD